MCYAKPLLLINDKQSKILIHHIFGQQTMCSNDDVDRSLFEPLDCFFLLRRAAKPA